MKQAGWILIVVGAGLLVFGFAMDTTTAGYLDGDRVHNLGLLSNRVNTGIAGGFVFLAGVTTVAAAAVADAVLRPVLEESGGVRAIGLSGASESATGSTVKTDPSTGASVCADCETPTLQSGLLQIRGRRVCRVCYAKEVV